LLSQAIRVYLSNQRQGTAKVKTRSEIARTKKKWFKQKGTGNARHGARTPNIFVGGGVSHGPTGLQNWTLNLSQTMKRQALVSALVAQKDQVSVHEGVAALNGKTAQAQQLLNTLQIADKKVLVVIDTPQLKVAQSFKNIRSVMVTTAGRLQALSVAQADAIMFTDEAVKALVARLTAGKTSQKPAVVAETKPAQAKKTTETKITKKAVKPATTAKKPAKTKVTKS
jgi:large subunit ribosomal protein L4